MRGDQLTATMANIIATSQSDEVDPCVKDGYIMMYIYLPAVYKKRFEPYLPHVIPAVLKALADDNEAVGFERSSTCTRRRRAHHLATTYTT